MAGKRRDKSRNFHQAKWDEEIIFELTTEGERGILIPAVEEEIVETVGAVTSMFTAMGQAVVALAAPFMPFINLLKDAISLAREVKDALSGSSMFHIVESVREVNPALLKLHESDLPLLNSPSAERRVARVRPLVFHREAEPLVAEFSP